MHQEKYDHRRYYDEVLDKDLIYCLYRFLYELGPIVRRYDLDAFGQARLDLFQFCLDPVDYFEGALAVTHDDDAGDDIPLAVEIRDASAYLRPQRHVRHVFDQDGNACLLVDADYYLLYILHR